MNYRVQGQRRHRRKGVWVGLLALVLVGLYVGWALLRPMSAITPSVLTFSDTKTTSRLTWPTQQAAVGVVGTDILETHGEQKPVPIASVAKVITSLVVLDAKPLKPGEQGPSITMTAEDVTRYQTYVANDGSVMRVEAGEQLSEYQAIQALMLPSANNVSDTLAIWAFGSLDAYVAAANAYLKQHDMTSTTIGKDASGLDPGSASTARDLIILGKLAMEHPVLSQIVGQATADGIPVVGTIRNVNFLLGTSNIVGIKTGNTDEAGGVYLAAAKTTVDDQPVTVVTALVGGPDLFGAMKFSLPLVDSAQVNFEGVSLIQKDSLVGRYTAPWGASAAAIAADNLDLTEWGGTTVRAVASLNNITDSAAAGSTIGQLTVPAAGIASRHTVQVKLKDPLPPPTLWWRLTHPL